MGYGPQGSGSYGTQGYGSYAQPNKKGGMGGLVLVIIGGILAMIGPFLFLMGSGGGETRFLSLTELELESEFVYIWFILIGGILALIIASIAIAIQKSLFGIVAAVFGLITMLIPIIFAFHVASKSEGTSVIDVFFESGDGYFRLFIGGILAIIGGLIAMIGGFALASSIKRASTSSVAPTGPTYASQPSYQQQPQYGQPMTQRPTPGAPQRPQYDRTMATPPAQRQPQYGQPASSSQPQPRVAQARSTPPPQQQTQYSQQTVATPPGQQPAPRPTFTPAPQNGPQTVAGPPSQQPTPRPHYAPPSQPPRNYYAPPPPAQPQYRPSAAPGFSQGSTLIFPDGSRLNVTDSVVLGRADFSGLVSEDKLNLISSRQMRVFKEGNIFFVEDGAHGEVSTNGTMLNGQDIRSQGKQPIRPGDVISVADVINIGIQ